MRSFALPLSPLTFGHPATFGLRAGVADHIALEHQIIGIKLEEKAGRLQLHDNQIGAAMRVNEKRPAGY